MQIDGLESIFSNRDLYFGVLKKVFYNLNIEMVVFNDQKIEFRARRL